MTSTAASPSTEAVPPPSHIRPEELTLPERAQLHIPAKRSFLQIRLSKLRSRTSNVDFEHNQPHDGTSSRRESLSRPSAESEDVAFIKVGDGIVYADELMEDYDKDVYRWAILYENQRGVTMFSAPYYSRLSLLPVDPPAFTLPTTSKLSRSNQPSLSLSTYPLPDGSWRWVSREWMVDMRGDGQTQYDGFEYNWAFRAKHWRPNVGALSAGGWVRRRRWVRLMVRPTIARKPSGDAVSEAASGVLEGLSRQAETGATRPPSVLVTSESDEYDSNFGEDDAMQVWTGDVEQDWQHCRAALRRLDRDGRRLELWCRWLRDLLPFDATEAWVPTPDKMPLPKKQWTEDSQHLPSQHARDSTGVVDEHLIRDTGVSTDAAAREHLITLLRIHCRDVLYTFVYPDSRTQFLELLTRANLLPELDAQLGRSVSSLLDFWSSSQSLRSLAVFGSTPPE